MIFASISSKCGQKKLARHENSKFRADLRIHFLPQIVDIVQL